MGQGIVIYTNHEGRFWQDMGPYFAFRHYAHEMGGWQFYTKPGSVWIVMYEGGSVIAFTAIIKETNHWYFDNLYVEKEHRGKGLSGILWKVKMAVARQMGGEFRAMSDIPVQIERYESSGFRFIGKRGRYSRYSITL